jgi:uncharacterized protein (DUF1501 family)
LNNLDIALEREAESVRCELQAQDEAWGTKGWTRRRFLSGVGIVGVAALGSQLVSTRAAYATTASTTDRTLIVVFLRGACDGLRTLVPATSLLGLDYLLLKRPALVPAVSSLLALPSMNGWALNPKLQPLYDQLWSTGELAFVPAVASPGLSRSHFQAQQYLEKGGSDIATSGWLDRVLTQLGPGTTFRAVSQGATAPAAMAGDEPSLTMGSINDFVFPGWDQIRPAAQQAVLDLYRGMPGPLGEDVPDTIAALDTAAAVRAAATSSVTYPSGDFAGALKNLATILKAEVGMQVATVDVGGWDTHTDEANQLDNLLASAAASLSTFMSDLGPDRRKRVTVVVMTEFGRRVAMNANAGADHGHGSVMWLLGGGLAGSGVYGQWTQLLSGVLDNGDVPGLNSPFDVLGELVQKRLGVGTLSTIFPGYTIAPLGVATTL